MRIPSTPIAPTLNASAANFTQPTTSVDPVKAVAPVVATLQTPARPVVATLETPASPLMADMVSDFGGSGVPSRISGAYETVEFVDSTKLKGHIPSAVIAYLVGEDPTTYNHTNTDFVPALTTVFTAGQSKDTVEPITGGPLSKDDFNNYVSKNARNAEDTRRFAVDERALGDDTRIQTVRVENIQQVMRDILEVSDIKGTALAKPFEKESDFSVQDRIEQFAESMQDKKTLAEEYQELKKKKEERDSHLSVSANPGRPEPVEKDVPILEILDPKEQALIQELELRDQEVRAHELAHKSAGAGVTSAATFTYQQGPDGKQYAIGGEVQIQIAPGNTPEETIRRAKQVIAAATAPADPSAADMRAAGLASQMEQEARAEQTVTQLETEEEVNANAKSDAQSIQDMQSDPLTVGRLPDEEITQLAAMDALQEQFKRQDQRLEAPTELTLERESERLTVAAPMGAYAQQFKLEQELDRRAFASLELAQEVAGVPTPQVVESREAQATQAEDRADLNSSRREEVEVTSPRIDIQPSSSPDVEDTRFNLTQDVQQSKEDLLEETINEMVDPIAEKEQMPQLQSFDGLNSLSNDSVNAIPRSPEGLASEISDLDPSVPQGVNVEDPTKLLQESVDTDKKRFSILLESQFASNQEQRIPPMDLSIEGNKRTIELEPIDPQALFQPDQVQIDFTEQAVTDGALAAQSTLDTTGPTRLTPMSEEDKRMQLTPQQEQSLETVQAVTALESMFGVPE